MRVVIDTNILISFGIRPSTEFERLFDHLATHGTPLVSSSTIQELLQVLSRDKFRKYLPLEKSTKYIEWYLGLSETITVSEHVIACRDPKDDKFLSVAIAGRADCIIAGDHDLLDMRSFRNIPIYRPAEFLRLFVK
jgi:putative PIN family toxin of toxin-antitoxin system